MTEKRTSSRRVLFFCLPFFCLLISCWCTQNFLAPLPGAASSETVLPAKNCVAWTFYRQAVPNRVCQLDLKSGQVSIVNLWQLGSGQLGRVGPWTIRDLRGIEILDARTGELRWSDKSLKGYHFLVGDQFLIASEESCIKVVDLGPVLGNATSVDHIKLEPVEFAIDGLPTRKLWADPDYVVPIAKTNRLLCLTGQPPGMTATVYEVSARGIEVIKAWPCADAPAIIRGSKVWTYASNPPRLEVRSLENFQLLQTISIPVAMRAELGKWSEVRHHKDLISFPGVKALAPVVCRLDNLSIIQGPDLPLVNYLPEKVADWRYHLLADDLPDNGRRIAVYDSQDRKIAYDARPPRGAITAGIVDRELVLVTEEMGLTVDLVDLANGRRLARYQPYRWYVLAMPVLLLVGLAWFVMWSRYSVEWLHPIPNIAFVALLFLTPLVWRMLTIHYWNVLWRPAVGFSLAALCAVSFAVAVLTALGTQRILLRLAGMCVWLSCVGVTLRGLLAIDGDDHSRLMTVESVLVKVLLFTVVVALTLFICRRYGVTPILVKSRLSPEVQPSTAVMPMRDLFALTGGIALMLSVLSPCFDYLREHALEGWEVGIIFAFAPLGLVALVRNQRVFRTAADIQIVFACVIIVAATLNLAWANCYAVLLYRKACDLSYLLLVMVGSFGLCSLMRPYAAGR